MLEKERQRYLSMHEYAIFQGEGKDKRWKTTLPDKNKKSGRRLIARKELSDLEDVVVEHYSGVETNPKSLSSDMTLEELYPIWLKSRMLEVNSVNTVKKNDQDWKRYYKGTNIVKIPIRELTVNYLKDWTHEMIDNYNMNKRSYYNMIVIIKKCFEYISDENICENTWSKVRINTKKLKKIEKKENHTQIFFLNEKTRIVQFCIKEFLENPRDVSSLIIPFLFVTGLRMGEVVALNEQDIREDIGEIVIRKSEVDDYEYDEETNTFYYAGKVIVEHAKTQAAERGIPYTNGARQIIDIVKNASKRYNYYDDGYIFCPYGKRVTADYVSRKLYRYCDLVGIPRKSAHKIRKTYISTIINEGIDLDTVCRISGHVDLKTTFQSYYYSLDKKDETYKKFNNMFQSIDGIEEITSKQRVI